MPVSEFKPGDLVTLKSGGPTMTFDRHIQSEGKVVCVWFDSISGSFKEFACKPSSLKLGITASSDHNPNSEAEPENGALI